MAIISSYPNKAPKLGDIMIFSETYDVGAANPVVGNPTKTTSVSGIGAAISPTIAAGATNNMAMFSGTNSVSSATPVTIVQDGVSRLTIGASDAQDVVYEANLELQAGLKDSTGAVGTAGQFLSSNGSATLWSSTVLDGFGTSGAIPKWSDTDTLTDSVMSETASGINLTGSLSTTTDVIVGRDISVVRDAVFSNDVTVANELTVTGATVLNTVSSSGLATLNSITSPGLASVNSLSTTLDVNIGRDTIITRDGSFGNNVTVGNDFSVTGATVLSTARITSTLADASSSVGTSGQVLSSTGTGTSWVDAAAPSSSPLEWSTQLFQSGTDAPTATTLAVDTLSVGSEAGTPSAYRSVIFLRVGVGTYRLSVKFTPDTVPTDVSKLTLMFGDAVCRVTNKINISVGSPQLNIWQFETRTPAGVLEDGLLNGSTGGYVNVKLY